MKRSFLILAALTLMMVGVAHAEDNQPPAEPAANAAASATTNTCKCVDEPSVGGDPQAPQNQVEYGGGA